MGQNRTRGAEPDAGRAVRVVTGELSHVTGPPTLAVLTHS